MDQTTVLKEPLTRDMIDAGARLVAKLEQGGTPLDMAYWIFSDEPNRWDFYVVSPEWDGPGYESISGKLSDAIRQLDEFDSHLLLWAGVTGPRNRAVQALQFAAAKAPNRKTVRITRWAPQDIWIEDALVYRTTQPALSTQS